VEIKITHSGVCHSDIHTVNGDWGEQKGNWPIVPGHEIIGHVTAVGSKVSKFKLGQRVGVGPQAFSCGNCKFCNSKDEAACAKFTGTYAATLPNGFITKGGYAAYNRTDEKFVVAIPDAVDSAEAAPLLCAGVTTFTPLRKAGIKKGSKVGVIGIGGLGHCAIQFGRALGAEVTAFSSSKNKEEEARKLGADNFLVVDKANKDEICKKYGNYFDVILNTSSADIDWNYYMDLIQPFGTMYVIGAAPVPVSVFGMKLIFGNKKLVGSLIGSPDDFYEMFKLVAEKDIKCYVEKFPFEKVNDAMKKVLDNTVRYRAVLVLPQ
jgi:uncharacterized zinc-type alcohol dehydrogenase-like protein